MICQKKGWKSQWSSQHFDSKQGYKMLSRRHKVLVDFLGCPQSQDPPSLVEIDQNVTNFFATTCDY